MCAAAYRPLEQSSALMDRGLFRRAVDSFPYLEEVHIQGIGEPFLHPEFFDFVKYAAHTRARVSTSSNLSVLTDEMARQCVISGLDTLHVSIDAAEASIYGKIRMGARLERVLANVERINSAKHHQNSKYPILKLVMVLMRSTLDQVLGVLHLAHDYGFSSVFVQGLSHHLQEAGLPARYKPLRDFVAGEVIHRLEPTELPEQAAQIQVGALFEQARDLAFDLGLELRLPPLANSTARVEKPSQSQHCDWPWTQAYVCYDGSVLPCCMVSTPDRVCMGSMRNASFSTIWYSPTFTDFRVRLDSDEPPAICRSCGLHEGEF
jgi:radical SAM protein with 4Fe4S-binding SPASM domain